MIKISQTNLLRRVVPESCGVFDEDLRCAQVEQTLRPRHRAEELNVGLCPPLFLEEPTVRVIVVLCENLRVAKFLCSPRSEGGGEGCGSAGRQAVRGDGGILTRK